MSRRKPRILIADDHPVVLEGLERILDPHFEVVGAVGDGRELVEASRRLRPNVVIADLSMPTLNGLEALRQLRETQPNTAFVILTVHADPVFAAEALDLGANGYVLKQSAATELVRAIREVLAGRQYVTPRFGRSVREAMHKATHDRASLVRLTKREREVLQLIAEGYTTNEAGAALGISPRTIEFHRHNIIQKTGLQTTAELARYAVSQRLV